MVSGHCRRIKVYIKMSSPHTDKFDQFWAVNRRLMESVEQEGFKHIPLRCYNDVSLDCLLFTLRLIAKRFSHRMDPAPISRNSLHHWRKRAKRRRCRTCLRSFQHLSVKQVSELVFTPFCLHHAVEGDLHFMRTDLPCTSLAVKVLLLN